MIVIQRSRQFTRRLADAADLMIDFATLGEYGLEPVAEPLPEECRAGRRRSNRLSRHSRGSAGLALRH
jgi:hypothetical protein